MAATAGIAIGPLFAVPLARRYGRTFTFFWSLVGLLVTGIWSATMTRSNQYGPFVAARLFGGLFGGTAPALGADTVVDMFFLHQRGKAFTVLNLSFLAGVVVGPTLSGFIVGSTNWTVQFWWSNALEGIIIILTLALLEDTYYDRTSEAESCRKRWPESFLANRMATFFCGTRVIPPISMTETVSLSFVLDKSISQRTYYRKGVGNTAFFFQLRRSMDSQTIQLQIFCNTFLIGICPVTLLCGALTLVDFGFAAFFNIILTVFLQDPTSMGGYAFTPVQNAECKSHAKISCIIDFSPIVEQFFSASGSASSSPKFTDISQTTASPSGFATATAASGSPNIDYTLSGYQALSFYLLLSAFMAPHCSTTYIIWCSR